MRRFPFVVGPLVGLVLLFFLLKILFAALIGAALLGASAMAVRGLSGRYRRSHIAAMRHRQPVPIDDRPSEPAFDWMPQNRIIEVI